MAVVCINIDAIYNTVSEWTEMCEVRKNIENYEFSKSTRSGRKKLKKRKRQDVSGSNSSENDDPKEGVNGCKKTSKVRF